MSKSSFLIDGNYLIQSGYIPGSWFKSAIKEANILLEAGNEKSYIDSVIASMAPKPIEEIFYRTNTIPFNVFLDPETEDERNNLNSVMKHMDALVRVPTVVKAAVMPDAMPSGSALGTIPVGGVVSTKNAIHPGFHSADICCSMAITVFKRGAKPSDVLDIAMKTTHFGYGKRSEIIEHKDLEILIKKMEKNSFLKNPVMIEAARNQFMTQGDGNHFFYVGEIESSNKLAIVTHHGSRSLGAQLYKVGMAVAKRNTSIISPKTPEHNAWINYDSQEGQDYWEALQLVRLWTKYNHFAIHDLMQSRMGNAIEDRFWNEHNFVFKRSDDLFYHGKGATPSFYGFSSDSDGRSLIPMNMAEPILMTNPGNNENALSFAPHGAGRNYSRTEHMRRISSRGTLENILKEETTDRGIDARFFVGNPDYSELPSSYKSAEQVERQIKKYKLANVFDRILPKGSIMAGELYQPWKNKKK